MANSQVAGGAVLVVVAALAALLMPSQQPETAVQTDNAASNIRQELASLQSNIAHDKAVLAEEENARDISTQQIPVTTRDAEETKQGTQHATAPPQEEKKQTTATNKEAHTSEIKRKTEKKRRTKGDDTCLAARVSDSVSKGRILGCN